MVEGARELSGAPFIRVLIQFVWALPPGLKHFPKAPSLIWLHVQVRISTYKFGERGGHKYEYHSTF